MSYYLDTSAIYAYLVPSDGAHDRVSTLLSELATQGATLFSSSFVLAETLGLLQIRHGIDAAELFLDAIYPRIEWRWIDEATFDRIRRVQLDRGRRSFTAVDASAVVCIEDRPRSRCIAIDHDLDAYDFDVLP